MALLVDLNNELFDTFSRDFLSFWFHDENKHFVPIQPDMQNLKKNKGKTIYRLELLFRAIFDDICKYAMKRLDDSVCRATYMDEITLQLYNLRECVKNGIISISSEPDYDELLNYVYDYHVRQLFNLLEIISDYENEESH